MWFNFQSRNHFTSRSYPPGKHILYTYTVICLWLSWKCNVPLLVTSTELRPQCLGRSLTELIKKYITSIFIEWENEKNANSPQTYYLFKFTLTLKLALSSRSSRSSSARKASAVVPERKRDGLREKAEILSAQFTAIVAQIPNVSEIQVIGVLVRPKLIAHCKISL